MQNLWGTKKSIMVFSEVALFSLMERFEQTSTAQKFTIERKLQDYLQLCPRTHTICFDACPPLREIT